MKMPDLQPDWHDPTTLLQGTLRQRAAHRALMSLRVFDRLRPYNPVLVGTLPIAMDIEGSDLDIICAAHDLSAFAHEVTTAYGMLDGFCSRTRDRGRDLTHVARFNHDGFPVEIFGQARPVTEQNAYIHMVVEYRLLRIGGNAAREAIRGLKRDGLKTEPAFAHYFGLPGEPYETLLAMAGLDDDALRTMVTSHLIPK